MKSSSEKDQNGHDDSHKDVKGEQNSQELGVNNKDRSKIRLKVDNYKDEKTENRQKVSVKDRPERQTGANQSEDSELIIEHKLENKENIDNRLDKNVDDIDDKLKMNVSLQPEIDKNVDDFKEIELKTDNKHEVNVDEEQRGAMAQNEDENRNADLSDTENGHEISQGLNMYEETETKQTEDDKATKVNRHNDVNSFNTSSKTCDDEDKEDNRNWGNKYSKIDTDVSLDIKDCRDNGANNIEAKKAKIDLNLNCEKPKIQDIDESEGGKIDSSKTEITGNTDDISVNENEGNIEILYSRNERRQCETDPSLITDFDNLSGIPIYHLSLLMGLFYPKRWASNNVVMGISRSVSSSLQSSLNVSDSDHNGVITGSMAQGLALPILKTVDQTGRVLKEDTPDIDIMFLNTKMCVAHSDRTVENLEVVGLIDTDNMLPGYLRLSILNQGSIAEAFKVYDPESRKYYIKSSHILKSFTETVKGKQDVCGATGKVTSTSGVAIDISTHGPALMVTDTRKVKDTSSRWNDTDSVFGFPCIDWPFIADEFKHRNRVHNWPPRDKVEYMWSVPCEEVGVPHRCSKQPDIEWRFSFSPAERCISNECLTSEQRHCYLILKILYRAVLKGLGLICSFDLKSVFFLTCEKLPLQMWMDKPGACLLYMLDSLISFVRVRFLPYYFIIKRNLIDHLDENQCLLLEQKLGSIRQNPISILQSFSCRHKFVFSPIFFGMEEVFKPLLADIDEYKQHKDASKTLSSANVTSAITLSTCHFLERRYDESFQVLSDADQLLYPLKQLGKQVQTIYSLVIGVITQFPERRAQAICFLKYVIKAIGLHNFGLLPEFYGTLAFWLHKYSCDLKSDPASMNVNIKAAEDNFVESLRLRIPNPFVELEYSHFLVYHGRHCDAMPYLMNVIDQEEDHPEIFHVYTTVDQFSVEVGIREAIIIRNGEFIVPSVTLAMYLLAVCYRNIGEEEELKPLVNRLSSASDQLKDEASKVLLGLLNGSKNDKTK